jgi:hypothetical protein
MRELSLLHQAPLRFAKYIISIDENIAVIKNEFDKVPSLAMLVEAAAQSSAAFNETDAQTKVGYLASLKNIKLINPPSSLNPNIHIKLNSEIENIGNFSFEVKEDNTTIATGSFVVITPQ